MNLFEPKRHEKIFGKRWDLARVEDFIVDIFDSTEVGFEEGSFWPQHPDDVINNWHGPFMDLYMGAAGVIWGQKHLENHGYGKTKHDYKPVLDAAKLNHIDKMDRFLKTSQFDNVEDYKLGLLLGEMGFLIAQLKLDQNKDLLEKLSVLAQANTDNSICEYMWGSPGTLTAILAYSKLIEPSTLIKLVQNTIETLENQLVTSPTLDCHVWQQNLYGSKECLIGSVHGFAGNAFSIIKSFRYLDLQSQQRWSDLFRSTVKKTALVHNSFANWPQAIDGSRAGKSAQFVQFCHGAPGIICCLSDLIDGTDQEFDTLMYKAGNLVFAAGPLQKGANLCHGTSGNGFAFLKLFNATGDQLWLDRAQSFAMIAMEQAIEKRKQYKQFRYSLWTGDIGLAIYLDACSRGRSEIPTMDVF